MTTIYWVVSEWWATKLSGSYCIVPVFGCTAWRETGSTGASLVVLAEIIVPPATA